MSIFAVMIGSFTLLLTQGFEQGWFSTFSFICLSIFIITTLIFIIIERRHEVPFIDFSVLRNRPFIGAFLNNFVLNSGLGVTVVFFIYAQTHLGLSAAQSGLVTLPYAIVAVAMIRLGEKATLRFGGKLMLIIGPLFPVIGITIISMTSLQPSQYIIAVVIGFVICAIGNGLVATPGLTIAIFSMPNEKVGLATGLYKMSGTLGWRLWYSTKYYSFQYVTTKLCTKCSCNCNIHRQHCINDTRLIVCIHDHSKTVKSLNIIEELCFEISLSL